MAKYRVGDRVYPIDIASIESVQERYYNYEFDQFDFVGIVTEVDKYSGNYSVAWLTRDRSKSAHSGLKTAWWTDNELTDDRERFLYRFNLREDE